MRSETDDILAFSMSGSIPLTSLSDKIVNTWSSSECRSPTYCLRLFGTFTSPDITSLTSSDMLRTFFPAAELL